MSKLIPAAGTYPARVNGKAVVYQAETGALCVAIPIALVGSDPAWSGKHTMTIVKKDEEVQTRTLETLKAVFPDWDGLDPFWLEDNDLTAYDLEVVGEHESYVKPGETEERINFRIQWLNAPGGASGMKMPKSLDAKDRKSVLTRYGSKFKAIAGSAPKSAPKPTAQPTQAAAPQAKPAPAPAKSAASGPPGRGRAGSPSVGGMPRTSSQEEVWATLTNRNPDKSPDDHANDFYGAIDTVKSGSDGTDLSPAEWGAVATALGL